MVTVENLQPFGSLMNTSQAVERACREPTLIDALTWIAIWESERAIQQAKANPTWETCFKHCFTNVMKQWPVNSGSPEHLAQTLKTFNTENPND